MRPSLSLLRVDLPSPSVLSLATPPRSARPWRIALAATLLFAVSLAQPSAAQNTIYVNTTAPGITNGLCSLQEAIYSAEFAANIAIGSTDPDATYTTGCVAGSGNGDTIVLPNDVFTFSTFWDGDAHNPFGPTATPIIFTTITIQGNGATLEPTQGAGNFRLFAVGYASIAVNGITYTGTGNLTIQDVYVTGFKSKGGDGGGGGGGGLGAGGAIYVGKIPGNGAPNLTVENSTFELNGAVGGNGASSVADDGGGGGGGLSGNGGGPTAAGGGGGGARGDGGPGGNEGGGGGGGGTVFSGAAGNDQGGSGGYLCGGAGGAEGFFQVNNGDDASCAGGGGGGAGNSGPSSAPYGGNGSYGGGGGGGSTDALSDPGAGGSAASEAGVVPPPMYSPRQVSAQTGATGVLAAGAVPR